MEAPFRLERQKCQCERVIQWLEQNGLLVQGLGPGTALELVAMQPQQGSLCSRMHGTSTMLLVETDEEVDSLTLSLIPPMEPQAAWQVLQQVQQHWHAQHTGLPLCLGAQLLQCPRLEARLPGGLFLAFGTKQKGLLFQVASPGWSQQQRIRVRSIGKSLACMVAVRLHEHGLLDLDDTVAHHLPSWDTSDKRHITLRQVLNHVSGLQPVPDSHPSVASADISLAQSAAMLAELPLLAATGQSFRYWGVGYQVLGAVVEQVTGKTWNQVFHEEVASPLGMTNTSFQHPSNSCPNPSNPAIGAACISTTADMLQYVAMLVHGGVAVGSETLITAGALPNNNSGSNGHHPIGTSNSYNSSCSHPRFISRSSCELLLSDQAPGADPSGCPLSSRLMQPERGGHLFLQGLRDAGIIPPELCEEAKDQAADIHYSFGGWSSCHQTTRQKNFTSLGYFNSVLHIAGADSEDPMLLLVLGNNRYSTMWQACFAALLKATRNYSEKSTQLSL